MATEKLNQVALLLTQTAQQADSLPKDGFQVTDIFAFFPQLSQIPGILDGKAQLIEEFKALTVQDVKALVAYVEDNLTLTNKRTEQIIESGFGAIAAIFTFIDSIKTPDAPAEETPNP